MVILNLAFTSIAQSVYRPMLLETTTFPSNYVLIKLLIFQDEIYEFIKKCIINPPGTRQPLTTPGTPLAHSATINKKPTILSSSPGNFLIRKRKAEDGSSPGNGTMNSGEFQSSGGETKSKYTKASSSLPSEYINEISSKFLIKYFLMHGCLFKTVPKFPQNIRKNPRFKIPSKPNGKVV